MKIYHNPQCSKSRQTLQLIQQQGIQPDVVEYLKTPPDAATLKDIIIKLGIKARDLLRSGEDEYKTSGLDNIDLSDEKIIAIMVKFPNLIERPIVVTGNKAIIGRPPEKVLDILS